MKKIVSTALLGLLAVMAIQFVPSQEASAYRHHHRYYGGGNYGGGYGNHHHHHRHW